MMKSHVIPNVCSEYSEHYFRDYQSVIPKSTYPIAWSYYNFLSSHWLAIWCIFRRSPLSEENYPNRNPAWKQALLTIDFQGNTRKGSSTSLSGAQQGSNYIFYHTDYQLLNHPLQSWSPVWTPHFPRDENIPIMQAFAGIRKLVIFLRFESRSH